jgi:hypothetical protein
VTGPQFIKCGGERLNCLVCCSGSALHVMFSELGRHMTAPPLLRDVTGYKDEAPGLLCRTSTSAQLVATIRPSREQGTG